MNTIDLTPLYRSSIGFDRLASIFDSAFSSSAAANGYPPYDIEVLEDNRYSITLAVAGFIENELDINVEKGVLSIKGKKADSTDRKFLHHGIANRAFERKFNLADFVEVTGAELTNGLLTVLLRKEVPEAMKPKKITIENSNRLINAASSTEPDAA